MKHLDRALVAGVLLLMVGAVLAALPSSARSGQQADIVLDGQRDAEYVLLAEDPLGDLGAAGGWPGTQWTDLTALYVAVDAASLYVYVDLPAYAQSVSSGEIGLALDTSGDVPASGGAVDPWGNAITFAYTSIYHNAGAMPVSTTHTILPDTVIRGNIPGIANNPPDDNNGWTELRTWDGSAWSGAGVNWGGIAGGGQIGSRVAYANGQGVEMAIPWTDLGVDAGSTIHLEFYATQKGAIKGAYDTVPADDQSATWDEATVQHHLATLAGSTPPPTVTPGPTSTPGPTPTPGPGPCSGTTPGDGDITTAELAHNSRKLAYRDPFGPIPMDGGATLRLRTCHDDAQQVQVPVWKTSDPLDSPSFTYAAAVAGYDPAGPYDVWEVAVPAPDMLTDQWYQFKVTDGSRVGYYHVVSGSNNSGPGAWSDSLQDLSWRLGTYLAGFQNTGWIEDAIIYQIFPDRFRNGSPANDPVEGTTVYGPTTCAGGPCVVDLHDNWLDPPTTPPYGVDFYGGDLEGVIEKLPYLADLGVNTLYLNPVFAASSNHGYDANDYYAIRGVFGGDAAFDALIAAADGYGIRVILDGCFNHTGSDSRYLDGYGLDRWPPPDGACESADSPFRAWYREGSSGQGVCAGGWGWQGWWGFETIPELLEVDPVKDLFYRGASPYSPGGVPVADYWVERGSAGWRFDVAQDISHDWWRDMRPLVKAHDPAALMLGEVTAGCMNWSDYLRGDELDGVMNYCFRDWAVSWASEGSPSAFDNAFTAAREQYPRPAFYSMMNLVDSHDTPRVLRLLGGDKDRLKVLVLLQMTLPGAPSVYYGDEVGLTGGGDPDCRRTYPWADEGGSPDLDLLAHYRQVIGIRGTHPALRGGEMETLLVEDAAHLYSFVRWNADEKVVVLLNNGPAGQTATVPLAEHLANGAVLTDTLTGQTYTVADGEVVVPLPGHWGAILVAGSAPDPLYFNYLPLVVRLGDQARPRLLD